MPRLAEPEPGYGLDADRARATGAASMRGLLTDEADLAARGADRAGARDLDQKVEGMPGLSRAARDRERAMPRNLTGPAGDPRMERQLPGPDDIRAPLSARQRRDRSATKRTVQGSLPQTQYDALSALVSDPGYRGRLNDALSDAAGDAQQLGDEMRVQAQRTDRAIQAYERDNRRGHVVYVNLQLPAELQGRDPGWVARSYLPAGSVLEVDRYTGAAHCLHEIEFPGDARTPVLEIKTRRGMYLGRSDSLDDTAHLLPRGLRLRVIGEHRAEFRRPDGTTDHRRVIQAQDLNED